MSKPDETKRMQMIGLLLLALLFGGWMYYQSWQAAQLPNRANGTAGRTTPNSPETRQSSAKLRLAQSAGGTENLEVAAKQDPIIVETEVFRAELSPEGAVMRSLILKQHHNNGQPLEMVRSVRSGRYPFTVYLGDYLDGQPVLLPFRYRQIGERAYRFRTEFTADDPEDPYILEKTLEFARSEYMVKVGIRLQRQSGRPLDANRVIYSLYYGPQIGPEVEHIGNNRTAADMRSYVYYNGRKSKTVSLSGRERRLESSPIWAGVSGKYFGVLGLPSRNLEVYWSAAEVPGLGLDASGSPLESSQFLFERRASGDDLAADTFYYYIGPLLAENLGIFDRSSDNEFGLSDAGLGSLIRFNLAFIEEPVKWILNGLYSFTRNYGLAIILFALIVRILLYPLTLKAYRSSSRMRLLQPQMKEIQTKYKTDPKRLQAEMANLYRTEKVNPVGGCLPLLIQMPILIAIANLFYRYFELRGAIFIPGWIADLSSPDLVYTLSLGWDIPLRLLPVIYLGSQLISSKLMQASQPPMQSKLQQRIFTIYLPVMFSFILYNMPSGLILYWTVSNLLMMVQQLLMTKFCREATAKERPQAQRHYTRHVSRRGGNPTRHQPRGSKQKKGKPQRRRP